MSDEAPPAGVKVIDPMGPGGFVSAAGEGASAGAGAGAGVEAGVADVPPADARYTVAGGLLSTEAGLVLTDNISGVKASVCPGSGGELSSLCVRDSPDDEWRELLYRGNDFTTPADDDWRGRAPNLFPAVGRTFTAAQLEAAGASGETPSPCRYSWEGIEHDFFLHGFLMQTTTEWEASHIETNDDEGAVAVISISSSKLSDDIKTAYPFDFDLSMTYSLKEGVLRVASAVTASGASSVPFSIGNHVTFKFPFGAATEGSATPASFAEGTLRGSATKQLDLTPHSLLTGESVPRPEFASAEGLSLGNPISCNMVVAGFADDDCSLELSQPSNGTRVKITQEAPAAGSPEAAREADLAAHRYFVLWGDAEKGFFCPEPWLGGPNSLNSKQGLVVLAPGEAYTWTFTVAVSRST